MSAVGVIAILAILGLGASLGSMFVALIDSRNAHRALRSKSDELENMRRAYAVAERLVREQSAYIGSLQEDLRNAQAASRQIWSLAGKTRGRAS